MCELVVDKSDLPRHDFDYFSEIFAITKDDEPMTNQQSATPSKIQLAKQIPIQLVVESTAKEAKIKINWQRNKNTTQIIEDGVLTSGYIIPAINLASSGSSKNRRGDTINIASYYLCELGGMELNAHQIADWLLSNIETKQLVSDKANNANAGSEFEEATFKPIGVTGFSEFMSKKFENIGFIVDRIIPKIGLTMFHAAPGSYKTWLYIQIISSICRQELFLDTYKTEMTNILIINLDDYHVQLQERLQRIQVDGKKFRNVFVADADEMFFDINVPQYRDHLIDIIREKRIGLLIIDTLRESHKKEENSSTEMRETMLSLRKIAKDGGTAILFTHHDAKSVVGLSGAAKASGSGIISGGCVSSFSLTYHKKTETITLDHGKSKLCKRLSDTELIFMDNGYPLFQVVEKPVKNTDEDVITKLQDFFNNNPDLEISKADFANKYTSILGMTNNRLKTGFGSLIDDGYLEQVLQPSGKNQPNGKKIYRLTKPESD
jgi:hypothetical protein